MRHAFVIKEFWLEKSGRFGILSDWDTHLFFVQLLFISILFSLKLQMRVLDPGCASNLFHKWNCLVIPFTSGRCDRPHNRYPWNRKYFWFISRYVLIPTIFHFSSSIFEALEEHKYSLEHQKCHICLLLQLIFWILLQSLKLGVHLYIA